MTYDKKALQELKKSIESGKASEQQFYVIHEGLSGTKAECKKWFKAYSGSLDAAISLLEAVLPGWDYRIHRVDGDCFALVHKQGYLDDYIFDVVIYPLIMSRALLLAILSALIEGER